MESSLKPWADIAFYKHRKHSPFGRYQHKIAPFLRSAFNLEPETMAVIRAPLDHLRSWYRYRAATLDVDFDGFVQAVIAPDPPEWAHIGTQLNFITDAQGQLGITHLFTYETQPVLRSWLDDRMQAEITYKVRNVSPPAPTPITFATQTAFDAHYAEEIALHARVRAQGGHLVTPV